MNKSKSFYGWKVIGALVCVLGIITIANGTYNLFFPFYYEEMGLTQTHLGLVGSICEMLMLILSIISGFLYGKLRAKKMLLIGAIIVLLDGIGVCFLAHNFGILLILAVFQGLGGMMAGTLTCMVTARKWFTRRAGIAAGLIMGLSAVFQGVGYWALGILAENIGWRKAWMVFSIIGGIVIFAASRVVVNEPSEKGLNPDGLSDEEVAKLTETTMAMDSAVTTDLNSLSMTLKQALRTSTFWMLTIGIGLLASTATAVVSNITGIAMTVGLEGSQATSAMSFYTYTAVLGQILGGILGDKIGRIKLLRIGCFVEAAIFLWAFFFMKTPSTLYIMLVLAGLVFLIPLSSVTPIFGDMFGMKYLSQISGVQMLLCGFFSAGVGAVFSGAVATATGSYTAYFIVAVVVIIIGFLLITFAKPTEVMKINQQYKKTMMKGE